MQPDDFRAWNNIVRRKRREQRPLSRERHRKSMSHRTTLGIVAIAALGFAAGALYWLHARGSHPTPEVVSAEPPGFHEASPATAPADKHVNTAVTNSPAASDAK